MSVPAPGGIGSAHAPQGAKSTLDRVLDFFELNLPAECAQIKAEIRAIIARKRGGENMDFAQAMGNVLKNASEAVLDSLAKQERALKAEDLQEVINGIMIAAKTRKVYG